MLIWWYLVVSGCMWYMVVSGAPIRLGAVELSLDAKSQDYTRFSDDRLRPMASQHADWSYHVPFPIELEILADRTPFPCTFITLRLLLQSMWVPDIDSSV